MTNNQVEFLHNLSNDELVILKSLFDKDNSEETKNYINFILEHPNLSFDKYTLAQQTPITYLPVTPFGKCFDVGIAFW